MKQYRLGSDKETDNKLRYATTIDGVPFKLYLPQTSVPEDTPKYVFVSLARNDSRPDSTSSALEAIVEYVEDHTETVHYKPVGDPNKWLIGEPYIPMNILDRPWPEQLRIVVEFL